MTVSDFHLECRQEEAALHGRIAELEAELEIHKWASLEAALKENKALKKQLAELRGLMSEALSNMEYYPASLGEYWLVQDSDITAMQEALQEGGNNVLP